MSSVRLNWTRITRLTRLTFVGIVAALLMVTGYAAWSYAYAVLHPGCQGDRASLDPTSYPVEAVEFPSRHGPVLRGWYTSGGTHPEIAIILVPGHGGNTWAVLGEAAFLAEAGFSTLIYEHRSCADPRLTASTGFWEAQDVLGAVDYLKSRPDVERIGGLGLSEGGTAMILAAAQEPALEAIIPMGGYASLRDDILDPGSRLSLLERVVRRMIVWSFHAQLGVPPSASSPVDVIGQISPRTVFLIYGEYEADVGQQLYDAAREPKDLWIVPGAGHMGYYAATPGEYEQRIIEFFDSEFGIGR